MKEENNEEFGRTLFSQFMNLYIVPEIEKRKQNGKMELPLDLRAAQIIFFPDGRTPEVRINSEVTAIGKVKLKTGVSKKAGEPIFENEVEGLNQIYLTDKDDPDCGHATLVRIGDCWIIAFDFRYSKGFSQKHIERAREFCQSAELSFTKRLWSPFVDSLFSAAELAAKSVLLSLPDPKFRLRATHKSIQMKYNRFAYLGNVKPVYRDTLNKLSGLRDRARYLKASFHLDEGKAEEFLRVVKQMIEEASDRIATA